MHFIGLVISSEKALPFSKYQKEFQHTIVSPKLSDNGQIWLYYKNKCSVNRDDAKLTTDELYRLQSALKRVRSDEIYQSYSDNFGYHTPTHTHTHTHTPTPTPTPRRKITFRKKLQQPS